MFMFFLCLALAAGSIVAAAVACLGTADPRGSTQW